MSIVSNQLAVVSSQLEASETYLVATDYPIVAVDAEWHTPQGFQRPRFLSKQFTFHDKHCTPRLTLVLWDSLYEMPDSLPEIGHDLTVISCDVNATALYQVAEIASQVTVMMYYSPKDVEAMLGPQVWRDILLSPQRPVSKLRNLTGEFSHEGTRYSLMDCVGAFQGSLDKAMESVGIDSPYKSLVTDCGHDKGRMDAFMNECPNEFLRYAIGDTIFLAEMMRKRVEQVNKVIAEALGPDVVTYTLDNFPRSSGSLVAKTFEAWLLKEYPEMMRIVLQMTDANNDKDWKALKDLKKKVQEAPDNELPALNNQLRSSRFIHGLGMGSIRNYALLSQDTGVYNAMVQGGRCINEERHDNPYANRLSNVIDIDLSGCYGSALAAFSYPIGIPTVYGNSRDDKSISLGDWLERYEDELVEGLYQIIVSGSLSFDQDLIHSKYGLNTKKIMKTIVGETFDPSVDEVYGREIETAHLGGNFVLTTQQIENGVITSENLKVLRAVCSSREWKEIKALKVVAAGYYPQSLEMSIDEWTTYHGTKDGLGGKYRKGDNRSRHWCRIPLEGFISRFLSYRKILKSKIENKGDSYDLRQNAVKLFVNTTYGDLAAPYFPMGNTILANNITAKARTGVWLMSKSLLTVQSITDGGMFTWEGVLSLKDAKKPSMHVFANRQALRTHRSTKVVQLTHKDVLEWLRDGGKEAEKGLDRLCLDHVNSFWSVYGLSLPFDIECKYENTARQAVYFGSSDYLLYETLKHPYVLKCRGAKQSDHPKQKWLWHLLDPEHYPVPEAFYEFSELLGVKAFLENPGRYADRLPGDDVQKETMHRPLSNGELYPTEADWKRAMDKKRKLVNRENKALDDKPKRYKATRRTGLAKDILKGLYCR
jgi:hypothetical protein